MRMLADYDVLDELGPIGKTWSGARKSLCFVSWEGSPPTLDLRIWHKLPDGRERPGKGITLTDEEAQDLMKLLGKYFNKEVIMDI